jgi:signal transduction histidine kinase
MSLGVHLVRSTMSVLVVALLTTGAATGILVAENGVRAQDAALAAAITTQAARGATGTPLFIEHGATAIRVWVVQPGDPDIPADLRIDVLARERPHTFERGGKRIRLTVGETSNAAREEDEEHVLLAASVPTTSRWGAVAPFLLPYTIVAIIVTFASWHILDRLVHRGLRPLRTASLRAEAATSQPELLGLLAAQGPVEVRELLEALDALLERREALAAGQAHFAREVAHELRTPVAVMLGEIDVTLRRPREAPAYLEALLRTRDAVLRLRDLVEGLMGLARAEREVALGERNCSSWESLLQRALAQEGPFLATAGCALEVRGALETKVSVHVPLVVAAIANLLRNAGTHAPGGPVHLTVETDHGRTRLLVDDQGPGVPEASRETSFGPLVRGAEARRSAPGGLGLGLALARTIAERHGGSCRLEEAPSGGCRSVLELPVAT